MNYNQLVQTVKKNATIFAAVLLLLLVLVNSLISGYNGQVLERSTLLNQQAERITKLHTDLWNDIIRNFDIGVRGYALTQNEALCGPFNEAVPKRVPIVKELRELLRQQGYDDQGGLEAIDKGIQAYEAVCRQMIQQIKTGDTEGFRQLMAQDKGKDLWLIYESFSTKLNAFELQETQKATHEYESAQRRSFFLQIALALLGTPTILFMIFRIRQDARQRSGLYQELERNNRQYLFNPGSSQEAIDGRIIIQQSILNFKKAANFISQLAGGNHQVEWEGLNNDNRELNQTNLTGELMQMREQLKQLKLTDEKRLWATEGIAQFGQLVRSNQHDLQLLCDQAVRFVVRYLNAQQGGLFLLMEEGSHSYLDLRGCYAFERKKFVSKRLELGQGLVGQTYLEGQTTMLTEIPQGYTSITSGLGDSTPTCLLIVPMLSNDKTEAVLEIAGFRRFEEHHIKLLESLGEILASSLQSVKGAMQTRHLLDEFQSQAQQLRDQEEEMRQNMEELQATQEEMHRKVTEYQQMLAEKDALIENLSHR
jgi:CHASE3 domain sensor protein